MKILLFCFLIFITRLIDTTLGTLRTITTVSNKKTLATTIAFIETIIWFSIFKTSIDPKNFSLFVIISYSLGFALGTYVGMIIIEKNSNVEVVVNIICKKNKKLIKELISNGYELSVMNLMGKSLINDKYMIFIRTKMKRVEYIKNIVEDYEKNALLVASESKKIYEDKHL